MSGVKKLFPSELRITQKWDYAIETFLVRVSVGALVGGLASIVLFRSKNPRVALTTFGAGFGAGDAYRLSNIAFENEKNNGGSDK